MGVKIMENVVSLRDKTTGKLLSVGMFGSGADKTLEEIKNYADNIQTTTKNNLNKIVSDTDASITDAETRRDTLINSITSVITNGTDTSLTQGGVAADAKTTGDKFNDIESEISEIKKLLQSLTTN